MRFDIITIFPKIFDSYLNESILGRAQKRKLIEIKIHNLRDFTEDKHKKVDDKPYGGGAGMVMQIQPIIKAVEFAKSKIKNPIIIIFTPTGKQFDNKMAAKFAKEKNNLILICGRYEGIDARLKKIIQNSKLPEAEPRTNSFGIIRGRQVRYGAGKIQNLSIGPYVLTGGELPAMILIDTISRQIPGVLGKDESIEEKRLGVGVPVYTRPETFVYGGKKYNAPKVLLSGNHKEIEKWRLSKRVKN